MDYELTRTQKNWVTIANKNVINDIDHYQKTIVCLEKVRLRALDLEALELGRLHFNLIQKFSIIFY